MVVDGEIVIVDEFTGRMMPGRQWQDGLHQAIQAKERLEVTLETITAARVTVQDFFLRYKKLAGMTGTAASRRRRAAADLQGPRLPGPDQPPGPSRLDARPRLLDRGREVPGRRRRRSSTCNRRGVPVLVGTRSIEKSEKLSALLTAAKIEHQILNAKNHEIEAQIVAQAGQPGRVTVATNMAGRGTDIKLGEGVAEQGGLHVIGTERHESRRIDRQLAGRCARQGDPGHGQFFVSLEDEIIEAFGEKPAARLRKRYRGRGELTSLAMRRLVRRPGQEGTPALPRPQAADELREATRRDAQEHGPQPGPGLMAIADLGSCDLATITRGSGDWRLAATCGRGGRDPRGGSWRRRADTWDRDGLGGRRGRRGSREGVARAGEQGVDQEPALRVGLLLRRLGAERLVVGEQSARGIQAAAGSRASASAWSLGVLIAPRGGRPSGSPDLAIHGQALAQAERHVAEAVRAGRC